MFHILARKAQDDADLNNLSFSCGVRREKAREYLEASDTEGEKILKWTLRAIGCTDVYCWDNLHQNSTVQPSKLYLL